MMDRSGFTISGIAWDRGAGISRVEISLDGGQSWRDAMRHPPLGPYAYRRFSLQTAAINPGS
jgi:sulfite dehydrogenase